MKTGNPVINPSYKYNERLKKILNLPKDLENDIDGKKSWISILGEGTDNYILTDDNNKKMILLVYRIRTNVSIIIMGETGCGKTLLIIKLFLVLNNGKKLVKLFNINPGIIDEEIINKMREINEKTKKKIQK